MERIGLEQVGVSRISSNVSSIVKSSSRLTGASGNLLPVALPTVVIDQVPRVCLKAVRPGRIRKRVIRPTAALTAVSSESVVDTLIEHGKRKPRTRRSRAGNPARRVRKTSASAIAGMADSATANDSELRRLAEALESAYHKDATTLESDYDDTLKALEAQTRTSGEVAAGEGVSSSSPTISSVRKRRGRPPRVVVDRNSVDFNQPIVVSPQITKDGFIVRSRSPTVVRRRLGEGKCRLNLVSRIALRKRRQDMSRQVEEARTNVGNAAQQIWSEEAEKLIDEHGTALELGMVDWNNLKRGLLSAVVESELALLMKPMKRLEKLRKSLAEEIGSGPSDEQWASVAQLDLHALRRHLLLGKSARNKLIQHNLRLVLFQAHKYHRDSSSLSLQDLCQEGVSGLLHGVDKFEPERGHRFSTYAVYWVRNSILRAQTRSGNSLRSPYNVAMHKLNIKRARLDLLVELERAPTDEEVMERVGLSANRFHDVVRSSPRTASMNKRSVITGEELVATFADKSDFERRLHSFGDDRSLRFGLDDALDSLKPREGLVLRQRFGLDGHGERTLGEIGQNLGISREMVRKYETCALMKMKQPTRMDSLRSYLTELSA